MATNLLPPITLDFGGLTLPTPADAGSEAMRRLRGDGTIPAGTPGEVTRMLDDTGGDPALETPSLFSDRDAGALRQTPDPADPLTPPSRYVPKDPPPEAMVPAWAMKNLVPGINPEQMKRNAAQFDPTFVDKAARALGLPIGFGRLSITEGKADQAQRAIDLQKARADDTRRAGEIGDIRKTVTDQIFPSAAGLVGPGEQPVPEPEIRPAPQLTGWRDFAERSVQSLLTGVVSLARAPAVAFDVNRALGAWVRGNPDIDQNVVAEKLQQVTDDIQKALPGDPARHFDLVSQMGSGGGSFASFLVGGAALKALGIPFKGATAAAGAGVGGTQMFDDARAHDATMAARYISFVVGAGLGTTEAIPINRALYWLNEGTGGVVSRVLATSAASGLEEMVQEVGQQVGQNTVARILYDHNRDIFDGVGDAGVVAFVLGSFFGMGAHASNATWNRLTRARASAPPVTPRAEGGPPPAASLAPGQGLLTEAAGPLAGQTVEVQGPTGDGAGYHVKLEDGTETIMGRNAVELPPETSAPAASSPQTAPVGDKTQTEEFKRWFGESKVVDEQGKPLVVYHGTAKKFNSFRVNGMSENAVYFTSDRRLAEDYADDAHENGYDTTGPRVVAAFLSMKNPLVVDGSSGDYDVGEGHGDLISKAIEGGHDSVIIRNVRDNIGAYVARSDLYLALDPTQIKSATGNSGAFDPSNPDISAIVTPEQALATNVPLELPTDPIFTKAVENTDGAEVTADGLLIDLVRFQKPEGDRAVRTGVFYLPAQSSDVRHYRNSKTGYGGTARYSGKTLLRRPLFVKGATGGKAPEQAYIAVSGKEAFEQMSRAVTQVISRGGNYMRPDPRLKLQLIEEFLDNYAPEMSGQGGFIESVSREGNTLRYALQELAVAHAVRGAGYDAVVGYSAGKKGPRISEVFDVREQTFPSKVMSSQVHPDFEKSDISAMQSPQRPRQAYPLERQRPATGIPEQQALPVAEQSPSKRDISDRFKDAINLVVKQGRFGGGHSKAEAIYKWDQSVARVKSEGQMLELFHEGGHHLHATLEPLLDPVITKHEAEIFKIADTLYGGGGVLKLSDIQARRREGFATFFQVYMNNPAEARVIAPAFLPAFETMMEQNSPGIRKELDGVRRDVERWLLSKSSAQLARERVVSSKPLGPVGKIVESIKGGTVLHDIATLSNRIYQATLNDQHPLTLAVRKLRTIAEENIRVQIERGLLDKKGALTALENLTRRGRADPVKMAALARNTYHASSEMIATGVAKYNGDGTAVSKGLAEILKDATGKNGRVDAATYADFNTYLAMRRIVAEWRNYYATLQWDHAKNYGSASQAEKVQEPAVKRFRRPDDVSLGDAQQAVADLGKANPQFAQAANDIYAYLDELLQYKVDAELLTQDAADRQRQIADYVPLRREMDDTKSGTLGKSKDARTGKDNLVRVFRGSDRRILSPVESIMQMTHETVALVAKNDVKKALVQLALDVGRGSGAVVEQIPASTMKGTSVKLADVIKAAGDFSLADEIAQAMGRDEITMQEFMDEVLDGDETGTIWRRADVSEKGEPILYVWRNGQIEAFQLNDPEWADQLYGALTELGKEQTNLAIQVLGAPAAFLRAGVTTSPPFFIANLVRDQLGAWVLNDGVYPVVSLGKGLASDLFDRKARRLYNLSMASIGGSNIAALDRTRFGTEQTMLAKAGIGVTAESSLTTVLRVLESTETFSRQGIWHASFKKARADGLSEADAMIEAGYEASDYANYGRAGSKMLLARRLVTFLNANLQGLDKSLRVALGSEGGAAFLRKELAPWVRRQLSPAAAARLGFEGSQTSLPMTAHEKAQLARAGRTLSKMMMLAIPSALLAALYWDDEEYQEFSPYLKGTRWMVKLSSGKWFGVPKPFQLATFATLVEYSIEAVLRGDPTAMQKFMQSQAAVIAPPYENPGIKLFYEMSTNTDMFSGRPIVTPAVAARPAWLQYDEYTSEAGKAIGRMTGASPMLVDHAITGSFATWGRGFLSASNLLNPDRPAQGFDDFAFTSYFVKDGSRSSTVRPAFLDLVGQQQGKLTGAYSGYKQLMDGGAEGQARDLLATLSEDQRAFAQLYYHQTADAKKLHPLRNAYDIVQTLSGLRKEMVVNRVRTGGKDDGEIIRLSPTQQKLINDRLSDLQVRVQRNALIATGQPGFANRKILPTYPLIEQIKAIDPRIAADIKLRMGNRIYTTDIVAKLWPQVKAEILANGPRANLKPYVLKAKAGGSKIWTETAQ